ncbi:hypothetical protein, partial [Enterococcus faecalis]|uniref:hypothetical protein n=1 Tax=Enterococcus faecalis TaxID=1351 RepID=UPI001C6168F6
PWRHYITSQCRVIVLEDARAWWKRILRERKRRKGRERGGIKREGERRERKKSKGGEGKKGIND